MLLLLSGPPFGPFYPPKKAPTPVKPGKPIVQPKPPQPTCGTIDVALPTFTPDLLLLSWGRTDVGDNHQLLVDVELRATRGRLLVSTEIEVRAEHSRSSYRRNDYKSVDVALPAGCQIAEAAQTKGAIKVTRSGHNYTKAFGSGLIDYATCRTDTDGDDIGKLRCNHVVLKPVTVQLEPIDKTCPVDISVYPPDQTMSVHHRRGDTDMGGNVVNVSVDANARIHGARIEVETALTMEEAVPDHTTFSATSEITVFDTAKDYPGCKIAKISRDSGRLRSHSERNEHDGYQISKLEGDIVEGTLLQRAGCRSDSDGAETGKIGCGVIEYGRVRVKLARK